MQASTCRLARWSLIPLLALAGCGAPETPAVAAAPPPLDEAALRVRAASGRYAVEGVTVQAQSGRQRAVSGQLELRVEGDRYQVDFDLRSTAPDLEGNVPVTVRGSGRGFVVGGVLTGTTEDWMALETGAASLGEVDLLAPLPAQAGIKIVSSSQATVEADGALQILLQNEGATGTERYAPSVTVLAGRRVPER